MVLQTQKEKINTITHVLLDDVILYLEVGNPSPIAFQIQIEGNTSIFLRERVHPHHVSLFQYLGFSNEDIKRNVFIPHNFDNCIRIHLYHRYDHMEDVRKSCLGYTIENFKSLIFSFFDYKSEEVYPVVDIHFPLRKTKKDIVVQISKEKTKKVSLQEGNLIQYL